MGGISIWQLLIIAIVVMLLFGTKKLNSVISDLGASIKAFKKAMSDNENNQKKSYHDVNFINEYVDDRSSNKRDTNYQNKE